MQRLTPTLLSLCLASACAPESVAPEIEADAGSAVEKMRLSLRFRARIGEQDFECGRAYPKLGAQGTDAEPRDLRMFVQDIALLRKADGQAVPFELEDRAPFQAYGTALLDFENKRGACKAQGTEETNLVVTGHVPVDEYDGVVFSNGVPESVNHADPLGMTPPLTESALHWNWLGGFMFLKAELKQAKAEQEAGSATLHLASRQCEGAPSSGYACKRQNRNRIELLGFDPSVDSIAIDVAALFADTDLNAMTACHSTQDTCPPLFSLLGIDFESGRAVASQSVYRVLREEPTAP